MIREDGEDSVVCDEGQDMRAASLHGCDLFKATWFAILINTLNKASK
jgi:hypothetical protein